MKGGTREVFLSPAAVLTFLKQLAIAVALGALGALVSVLTNPPVVSGVDPTLFGLLTTIVLTMAQAAQAKLKGSENQPGNPAPPPAPPAP